MEYASKRNVWADLIPIEHGVGQSLQMQIRKGMVAAILDGRVASGSLVPSSRALANALGVSRGTVIIAYRELVGQGFLTSKRGSGYRVSIDHSEISPEQQTFRAINTDVFEWHTRLKVQPGPLANPRKSKTWTSARYPFVYGQFDLELFPTAEWRECNRMALSVLEIQCWAADMIDQDDPMLVEQIQARVLNKRGVFASPNEIIVTLGAQHALYMMAALLIRSGVRVAMEEPGYPEARSVFKLFGAEFIPIEVDDQGMCVDKIPDDVQFVFTTPGHHCPSMAPLSTERRERLLARAAQHDWIIIEDDYNSQIPDIEPEEALKRMDSAGRVIHIGSMSKTLAPGLRLGFLVATRELIRELRALRQLMVRHPPANNQRAVALFMALGHHDTLVKRLSDAFEAKRRRLLEAVQAHLPEWHTGDFPGATALWVRLPDDTHGPDIVRQAAARDIYIESGARFFDRPPPTCPFVRLGVSAISLDAIDPGVELLGSVYQDMKRTQFV